MMKVTAIIGSCLLAQAVCANLIINNTDEILTVKIELDNDANNEVSVSIQPQSEESLAHKLGESYDSYESFTYNIVDSPNLSVLSVKKHHQCQVVIDKDKVYSFSPNESCK